MNLPQAVHHPSSSFKPSHAGQIAPTMVAQKALSANAGTWESLTPALSEGTLEVLSTQFGFAQMTPVQAATIPQFLTNKVCLPTSPPLVPPLSFHCFFSASRLSLNPSLSRAQQCALSMLRVCVVHAWESLTPALSEGTRMEVLSTQFGFAQMTPV